MKIDRFSYHQHPDDVRHWHFGPVELELITLVVGKNASGKSRFLSVLSNLAHFISGTKKFTSTTSGHFELALSEGQTRYRYNLSYEDAAVKKEEFYRDQTCLLSRKSDGSGEIFAEKAGEMMPFQTPVTELAIRNRRDTLQHAFFEPIHLWAEGVRLFSFGTPFGRDTLAVLVPGAPDFDDKNVDQVLALYRKGDKEFPDVFCNAVIHDMNRIGYDLTGIGAQTPTAFSFEGILPGQLLALYVQEKDLDCKTEQIEMSQGMFRALAICIHLNYAAFSKAARTCILIDDIGEGLDFDRSCALIKVIMEKATASGAQLVMSTNDRYVMNNVPLEHWAVIIRNGATCSIVTPRTNPMSFEEFRFTGLSNFDFFSMDFAKGEQPC